MFVDTLLCTQEDQGIEADRRLSVLNVAENLGEVAQPENPINKITKAQKFRDERGLSLDLNLIIEQIEDDASIEPDPPPAPRHADRHLRRLSLGSSASSNSSLASPLLLRLTIKDENSVETFSLMEERNRRNSTQSQENCAKTEGSEDVG